MPLAALLALALAADGGALQSVESIRPTVSEKYPSLAFGADGRLWMARVLMEGETDAVVVRARADADWGADEVIARGIEGAPRLLADGPSLWLFWHGRRGGRWDVYARRHDGRRWGAETRLTGGDGAHAMHPVAARDAQGRVFLAYESVADGVFAIEARVHASGAWSAPARISSAGLERRPALAAGHDPGAWLAWDSTRSGNPDVLLARLEAQGARPPRVGPPEAVTADAAIDDSPSLALDPRDGTLWVAWNSMRGHAKDTLRTDRHSGDAFVRLRRGGRWLAPPSAHAGGLPGQVSFGIVNKTPRDAVDPYWHWKSTQNYPAVALDGAGRAWIVWRTDATGAHNFDLWGRVHDGAAWSDELHLTAPYGGRDEWPATAVAPDGALWLAWEGQPDPSDYGGASLGRGDVDRFNTLAAPNAIFLGRLEPPAPARPAPLAEAAPDVLRTEDLRLGKAPGPPAGGVPTEDGRFRIFFGDPHSHSILSDGKTGHPDQVLYLARDHVGLDFAVVSDHSEMGRLQNGEYAEIRALARAFTQPGRFLSFSGFEWTAGSQFGHRVVLFKQDETPQLAFSSPEGQDIRALYELARRHDGLMSPHHTGQATWGRWNPEHHDAEVEPNFEIASWHGRFEFYENPWQGRRQVPGHQYQDQLRRGRKVGVMGASDTHHLQPGQGGLTAVLAESLDRGPLFEAVRRRRNYATTGAKIVLEFTADGAPMGSEIESSGPVAFVVRVEGTAPIDRVEIVKDLVDTHAAVRIEQNPAGPDGAFMMYDPADPTGGRVLALEDMSRLRFEAKDAGPPGREHVYYVRVTQADHEQAWSSPIWVRFR